VLSISCIPEKNGYWDLTYHILSNMYIKYIWQAYRNKATYKGGRRTWDLRCFETGSHFLVELFKTTGHNYCSLLTSIPDPGNFGTDPNHRIRSRKKRNFEKFRKIKKLFREIRNKYFAKLSDREISSTTLPYSSASIDIKTVFLLRYATIARTTRAAESGPKTCSNSHKITR
jgi:hypothetical protein